MYIYIQDLKNIKNVKRSRDGMPKSIQTRYTESTQTRYRDDIIVKANLQSLIPASFSHKGLCKFTFTIISSLYLVCVLSGMPSLHLFTLLMFFKSCLWAFCSVTVRPKPKKNV